METKQCSKCGEVKPVSEFSTDKQRKDGLYPQCKACRKPYREENKDKIAEYQKSYREVNKDKRKVYLEKNKDKITKKTTEWKEANKEYVAWLSVKHRAKRNGIAFELTEEDTSTYNICPVFGWELKRGGVNSKNNPSIDRIDPNKGYTKDNIQILSYKANAMKQDATPEELIQFAEWILRTYQK